MRQRDLPGRLLTPYVNAQAHDDGSANDGASSEQKQADCEIACQILQIAHRKRTGESREVTERVDCRDPRSSRGPGQETCRQRPEHRRHSRNADLREAKQRHDEEKTNPDIPIPIAAMSNATAT